MNSEVNFVNTTERYFVILGFIDFILCVKHFNDFEHREPFIKVPFKILLQKDKNLEHT